MAGNRMQDISSSVTYNSAGGKKYTLFMTAEGSLHYSKESAIGPKREPDDSSPILYFVFI